MRSETETTAMIPSTPKERPIGGLHHLAIAVQDLPRAERFYRDGAGSRPWPAAQRLDLPAGARSLCMPNAGLVLLAAEPTAPLVRRPVSEAGIAHACIQTPDIGTVVNRFLALDARLHSDPVDLGTGFLYCYARDPEANVIEVECVAPVWADARPWLAHANIATPDLRRLLAFYKAFLGVDGVSSPLLRDNKRVDTIVDLADVQLRAAWLNLGNTQLELMQYVHPATLSETGRRAPGAPGFAHLAFEVRGLAEACAHLSACGGQLLEEPAPAAWQAYGLDPDGNRLLLLDLSAPEQAELRISALADPQITHRFSVARTALMASR